MDLNLALCWLPGRLLASFCLRASCTPASLCPCSTQRDAAAACANPLAPAHTAAWLSVLSGAEGSAVQVG